MEGNSETREAVKVYKALGEPTRLNIVQLLASEPDQCCVSLGEKDIYLLQPEPQSGGKYAP